MGHGHRQEGGAHRDMQSQNLILCHAAGGGGGSAVGVVGDLTLPAGLRRIHTNSSTVDGGPLLLSRHLALPAGGRFPGKHGGAAGSSGWGAQLRPTPGGAWASPFL